METLIIQVDCRPFMRISGEPPQLGITVEAPYSEQRKQLQAARDYRNHDYHNLDDIQINSNSKHQHAKIRNNNNSDLTKYSTQLAASLNDHHSNQFDGKTIQNGLQITQIQEGSVIDRIGQFRVGDIIVEVNGVNLERPFAEAQKTLKQFVIEHTSHGPLILKVLRRPESSSSSIPSTIGSQTTVIEQNGVGYRRQQSHHTPHMLEPDINQKTHQQFKTILSVTQATPVKSSSPTSPKTPSTSSKTSRHLVGALNTRRIGTRYRIKLRKGPGGFGIKIAERDNMHNTRNRPIYVTAITTTGSAYQDGQLKEGDMLLEVNGIDLHGKSQPEVTKMLKSVKTNEEVDIVVSRQENVADEIEVSSCGLNSSDPTCHTKNENDDSLIDLDVPEQDDSVFMDNSATQFEKKIDSILNDHLKDGPGNYVYDIPLNDTKSAGLGLYLKYPRRASDHKDLGIWIEKVITGGAAWKDGRLQPNDQILAINGISLVGLSNVEASETLTAAVCRGIGPEATANIIKLNIQRRDPAVAAKILLGTNNSIEHSDMITRPQEKIFSSGERNEILMESYKTEATMQNRSTQSSQFNNSSGSSNQNSQNDSAMSPQTQASSSLKISSFNDQQNSSDKTNETTSSAISQITDFTSVPTSEQAKVNNTEQQQNSRSTNTLPKLLHSETQSGPRTNNDDNASSSQSWDDESSDANITGEEAFQRDGFGRQSISEKRHAQLNAKNTDTFRRNQKMREERERQRELEEQMARQKLDDGADRRTSYYLPAKNDHKVPSCYTTSEFESMYGLKMDPNRQFVTNQDSMIETFNREVPVDVYMPTMNKESTTMEHNHGADHRAYGNQISYDYSEEQAKIASQKLVPNINQYRSQPVISNQNMIQANRCLKCGAYKTSCLCESLSQQQHVAAMRSAYQIYGGISNLGFDHSIPKRSNSLESIQQHQLREGLVVPRAGTVRVARNRKVNESFRAAVDRSYEGSANESCSRHNHSELSSDHQTTGIEPCRITSSIANSTASTSNEEKHLINKQASNGNHQPHKKSSSLLTKLIKFGSIKKKKKKNRDEHQPVETKEMDKKSAKNTNGSQIIDQSTRSHSSKSSHARTNSSQSHPKNISNNHDRNRQLNKRAEVTMNGQVIGNPMKMQQQPLLHANQIQNGFNLHHPHRMSMPMCQYQQPLIHNDINTQYHSNQAQSSMTIQTKPQCQYNSLTLGRPTAGHPINNDVNHVMHEHQQYSYMPVHHQSTGQHFHPGVNQPTSSNHIHSADMHNNQVLYHQAIGARDSIRQHLNAPSHNGCRANSTIHSGSSWQLQAHHQAPNGLWVTNSPTSDNILPAPVQNIYGALPQQQPTGRYPSANMENNYTGSHNPQPGVNQMMTPFIPQIAGPPPPSLNQPTPHLNGMMHNHQRYDAIGAPSGHNHNNMQPQHIYYYDF